MARKNTTTVAVKSTSKKTSKKTTRKSTSKNKPSQTDVVDLKTLFKGKSFCVTGRFSYYPEKKQLVDFIKYFKGTVTDKVNKDLDVLVVGSGAKTGKQKSAEKLNASGEASIEIIDNFEHLVVGIEADIPGYLTNPNLFTALKRLMSERWLFPNQHIEINGADFSRKTIGSEKESEGFEILFKNCDFSSTRFLKFNFGIFNDDISDCRFDNAKFDELYFHDLESCSFNKTSGNKLTIGSIEKCEFTGNRFKILRVDEIDDCTFDNVKADKFSDYIAGFRSGMKKSRFSKCVFKNVNWEDMSLKDTSMADCQMDGGKIRMMDLDSSELASVHFKNIKFDRVALNNSQVIDAIFTNCEFAMLDCGNANLKNVKLNKCKIGTLSADKNQLDELIGADKKIIESATISKPNVDALAKAISKSAKLSFDVECTYDKSKTLTLSLKNQWSYEFKFASKSDKKHNGELTLDFWPKKPTEREIASVLNAIIASARIEDVDLGSLKTKTSKCTLKPKELKELIITAIYEVIGKEPKSGDEIKKEQAAARKKTASKRAEIKQELESGEVSKINKRSAKSLHESGPFKDLKLAGKKLSGIQLPGVNMRGADLENTDLTKAKLSQANLSKSKLSNANLSNADLTDANLTDADLSKANLSNSTLAGIQLQGAVLSKTNFSKARFTRKRSGGTSFAGVDFSDAVLNGALMKGCWYDEKTIFPKSFSLEEMKTLHWIGGGIAPHERKHNKKADGPLDFDAFMNRLSEITDSSRLQKSMKMLKADSFQLFSEVTDDSMLGVVKSQTDASLVYSCALNSDGTFTCCTQKLNPCGGLRGALCKHLLVLIVGLTKNGELDPTNVDDWVNNSQYKQPELDKDRMSEVLLKYKGAEAGDIDWRPTETVPEDFMAF